MVIQRKRVRTLEIPASTDQIINDEKTQLNNDDDDDDEEEEEEKEDVPGYEQYREKRIKENIEKLKELGITNLLLKLKSDNNLPSKPSPRKKPSQAVTPQSSRSSSRLRNRTPESKPKVNGVKKKEKSMEREDIVKKALSGEDSKREIYSDKHEKLLGKCERNWTLFVDGYGKDGKRIFDWVKGKLCHQCGQKTVGFHTHCNSCNLDQGQLCGDCLFMRYGENVLEAKQNPHWICPFCRGICNCNPCREGKGWQSIGNLYYKVSSFGFKSVAHYLIQTRR